MNRRQFGLVGLIGSFLGVKESRVLATPRLDFDKINNYWGVDKKTLESYTPIELVIRLSCLDSWAQRTQLDWYPQHRKKIAESLSIHLRLGIMTFDQYYGAIFGLGLSPIPKIGRHTVALNNKIAQCTLASIADAEFNLKERYRRGEIT